MKVKATKMGQYDHRRIREGQMFILKDKKDFSHRWMESLEEEKPKKSAPVKKEVELEL